LSFDVTDSGEVTNVIASLSGTVVTISARYPIDGEGRWGGVVSARGIEARLSGRVGRRGASGTLLVEPVAVARSAAKERGVRWKARLVGDPH
jgi:hypothetical protein